MGYQDIAAGLLSKKHADRIMDVSVELYAAPSRFESLPRTN